MDALQIGLNMPENELPKIAKAKPRPATPPMADLLKVLLKIKCEQARVATRMVASAQELEAWAAEPHKTDLRALHGWRDDIFGKDARKLMKGDLALTANRGNIEIVELEEE